MCRQFDSGPHHRKNPTHKVGFFVFGPADGANAAVKGLLCGKARIEMAIPAS
jgi:hypothetical protein